MHSLAMVFTLDLDLGPPAACLWLLLIPVSLGLWAVTMTERPHVIDHLFVLTQVATLSNIINTIYWKAVDVGLWVTEWFGSEGGFLCRQQVLFTIGQSMMLFFAC